MDGESLLAPLYNVLRHLAPHRRPREQFSDAVIAGYVLWAAMENKPVTWASQVERVPRPLAHHAQRPSQSTLSRRGNSAAVLRLLDELMKHWLTVVALALSRLKVIDGMPLRVGFASHDRTAKFGRGGGGKARGYRLLAILDLATGLIEDWLITPMNRDEAQAARDLVSRMTPGTYLLGDTNFDKNHLYELASQRGIQLLAPKKRSTKGLGHHRHSRYRLHAKRLLARRLGKRLMQQRRAIERRFGNLVTRHTGLTHLPPWIRGMRRVGRWCHAKLAAYNLAQLNTQELT